MFQYENLIYIIYRHKVNFLKLTKNYGIIYNRENG